MRTLKNTSSEPQKIKSDIENAIDIEILPAEIGVLSQQEQGDLRGFEQTISTRVRAFFEVGEALVKIKERKLYRAEFSTFEDYCRQRWDFSRMHANRLLHAAAIRSVLIPLNVSLTPENERQIRPLIGLPPKIAERAWLKTLELAAGQKVTGTLVGKAVRLVSQTRSEKLKEKESWQMDLQPLLKKGLGYCRSGDRDKLTDLVNRMSLLLDVGVRPGNQIDGD